MTKKLDELARHIKESRAGTGLVLGLGFAGMALILLSELWPASTPKKSAAETAPPSVYEYQAQLEARLAEMIAQVDGAGRAVVMVTLETGEETVYAMDTQQSETESRETHVLLDDGSALAETVYLPAVCGVAVVCEGGDQVHVTAQITELLSALLDLSSNRICVEKMKQ